MYQRDGIKYFFFCWFSENALILRDYVLLSLKPIYLRIQDSYFALHYQSVAANGRCDRTRSIFKR